jgi:hypothetical protein
MNKDLSNAAKWLTQGAGGKMSKQEVLVEDIVKAWPQAVRLKKERKRKEKGKVRTVAVGTDLEEGSSELSEGESVISLSTLET